MSKLKMSLRGIDCRVLLASQQAMQSYDMPFCHCERSEAILFMEGIIVRLLRNGFEISRNDNTHADIFYK